MGGHAPTTNFGEESWTALAAWAADELGVRVAFDGKCYRLEPSAPPEDAIDGPAAPAAKQSWFRRRRRDDAPEAADPVDEPTFESEHPADVVVELVERLQKQAPVVHARPVDQPTAVHDLSSRLFRAYTLDNGQAHLAGCHFEDVPLVRHTVIEDRGDNPPLVRHRYFNELGDPLAWESAVALGIDRVAPFIEQTPVLDDGRRDRMVQSVRRADDHPAALLTIVWAKRAWGRLRFEFGDRSIDTPFDGWARTLEAPPVVCPQTGRNTFHLATLEDGEIAAAEEIAECAVSGHRHLVRDLVRCSESGQLAERELTGVCAASGEPVLSDSLLVCPRCGLKVSPSARRSADCDACRRTKSVAPDDKRLSRILAEHPNLANKKWALAETPTAFVLEHAGWLRRRVVTVDRETLALLHAAEASRMSSTWRPLAVGAP